MTDIIERVGHLSPAKRALLQRSLAGSRSGLPGGAIPRRDPAGASGAPLSFAQERMWFFHRFEPASAAYNIPLVYSLDGPLDRDALAKAVGRVVARHGSLRTTFRETERGPVQIVRPAAEGGAAGAGGAPASIPVSVLDSPPGEREEEALRLATEEVRRPFDLEAGPLFRVSLIQIEPERHLLVLVMHHIISDGWSAQVFFREVSEAYSAFRDGREPALPDLPIQYTDFALWQREYLAGPIRAAQLDYWRRELEGAPLVLELPTDRPRPPIETYKGTRLTFEVPADLTERLRAYSREEDATLFITLLAAFMVLLGRYSRQEDLLVGTPIANRNRSEVEGLIGFFVNSLAMRGDLRGDPTFREFTRRLRAVALGAYDHQDLPFETLVEELHPQRSLSRQPIYQVMFAHQPAPGSTFSPAGLVARRVVVDTGESLFDLTLSLDEHPGGLDGTLVYSTALFDRGTMEGLARSYRRLLEDAATDPDRAVSRLPSLSDDDRRLVLETWNNTTRAYPRDATIHELFEATAAARPDKTALVWGAGGEAESLTYAELDRWSGLIAGGLIEAGAYLEAPVGVSLDRSPEMVASLLGVLKAGGFYVPLDPAYPAERLEFMMRDAGVRLVIAREEDVPKYAPVRSVVSLGPGQTVKVIAAGGTPSAGGAGRGLPRVYPDNLAYSVYTSGSTGTPKGVAVSHRAVVRLVRGSEFADLGPDQVFLQLAPVNFDASTLELWGALLNGGKLAIAPPGNLSLADLGQAIRGFGVTILWLTAGLFNVMLDEQPESLAGLRQLLFGGEAASRAHVAKAWRALPGVTLINGYGPTENTTFTTCFTYARADRDPGARAPEGPIPIGRPITNTTAYVLDGRLEPCPPGIPGELCTGGDGLARGYLARPDLTAERFVPNPFGRPGDRLYRTGDLVRHLPGGDIEFLSRLDFQVKLRGFRIELGEIEATLRTHPDVRDAVCLLREDEPGSRRLVAYVAAAGGQIGSRPDLKAYLASKVPDYMVPAAVLALGSLPLGPTGKVNRAALPVPDLAADAAGDRPIPPRTRTETVLAGFWSELLRLEKVGVNQDFFELGGHSLLATQLVSRIRHVLGVEIPLRSAFERPTIEGLAALVDERLAEADAAREASASRDLSPVAPAPGAPTDGPVGPDFFDRLSAKVDELSDSEVDSLINYLLGKEREK